MGTRSPYAPGRISGREAWHQAFQHWNSRTRANPYPALSDRGPSEGSCIFRILGIPSGDAYAIHKRFGEKLSGEILSLSQEKNPELTREGIMALGARLEEEGRGEEAGKLYAALASSLPRAQSRLETLQGKGSFGGSFELAARRLVDEVSDYRMVLPMLAGTVIGQGVRASLLTRLGGLSPNGLTRGLGARFLAGAGALAFEAPVFGIAAHSLRDFTSPLGADLGSAAITLGMLKIFGFASSTFSARAYRSLPGGLQLGIGGISLQAGLFTGLLSARKIEESLGLRPSQGGPASLVDTLGSLIALQVGARLASGVLGPNWSPSPSELENNFRRGSIWAADPAMAGGPRSATIGNGMRAEEGNTIPKPLMMGDYKWKDFQQKVFEIRSNPSALTPEVRVSLPKLAQEVNGWDHRYQEQPEWHAALALRDHSVLQRLAKILLSRIPLNAKPPFPFYPNQWEDALLAHLLVEDYSTAFNLGDHLIIPGDQWDEGDVTDFNGTVLASIPIRDSYSLDYAHRKGFSKVYNFNLIQTLRDLLSLAQDYDVFIGLARGGLYSASVVDLLQLPNFVLEVHAHGKRNPFSRWVEPVSDSQIAGKRVLLLDKDAVTGATVAEAVRRLRVFNPAKIGIYFNHGPGSGKSLSSSRPPDSGGVPSLRLTPGKVNPKVLPIQARRRLQGLEVTVHHPGSVAKIPLATAFLSVHERLKSSLSRMKNASRIFQDGIMSHASAANSDIVKVTFRGWLEAVTLHDSINPLVPGARQARGSIVNFLDSLVRDFQGVMGSGLKDPGDEKTLSDFSRLLEPVRDVEKRAEDFAWARYQPWGLRLAEQRGISLEHVPHAYAPAFRAAREALQSRAYEVALIVGPEAFAYEPIFRDLGIPTLAVNIPEADYGGRRTMKKLDPLNGLKDKRVLVVEDDVRSGATLHRLLRGIRQHGPFTELGLYLGLPHSRQMRENIPKAFQNIFVSDPLPEKDDPAFMEHVLRHEKIYQVPDLPEKNSKIFPPSPAQLEEGT